MIKNKIEFIIQIIATIVFIFILYLPNDMYVIKGLGNIIFITLISKYNLKKVLSKGNKKDISILIISYMILCIAMLLPTNMFAIRMIGLLVFAVELFKEDITTYFKRPKKDKS